MRPKSRINALDRGLHILEILAEKDRDIGVTEVSRQLVVDKSTAYRLLSTLMDRGYVSQDLETKRYGLGIKVAELGGKLLGRIEPREEARPFLKELTERTGETALLVALVHDSVIRIEKEENKDAFKVVVISEIGTEAPAHCTAAGKAILAYLTDEEVERIVKKKGFKQYTVRTITSLEALKLHLRRVREQGYAFDDEEFMMGVRCIGVPIKNHTGKVAAAVNIAGPSTRLTLDRIPELADTVKEIGEKISTKLGFQKG